MAGFRHLQSIALVCVLGFPAAACSDAVAPVELDTPRTILRYFSHPHLWPVVQQWDGRGFSEPGVPLDLAPEVEADDRIVVGLQGERLYWTTVGHTDGSDDTFPLHVSDLGTGHWELLGDFGGYIIGSAVEPGGRRVALARWDFDENRKSIEVRPLDGHGDVRVVAKDVQLGGVAHLPLSWGPSPGQLTYSDEGKRVMTVDVDRDGEPRRVTNGDYPVWSPDGALLAFEREGEVWIRERESGRESLAYRGQGALGAGTWSTDGRFYGFTAAAEFMVPGGQKNWVFDREDGRLHPMAEGRNGKHIKGWLPEGLHLRPGGASAEP